VPGEVARTSHYKLDQAAPIRRWDATRCLSDLGCMHATLLASRSRLPSACGP
jgi:hypothetical protein